MNTPDEAITWWTRTRTRTRTLWGEAINVVFGDRVGLTLFFSGLVFFMFHWRVGIFITDTAAIGNTLVNVVEGRLHIAVTPFADLEAPGTYVSDGIPYGRNYGIVFAAVPVLWAIEATSAIIAPKVLVVALWSLLVVGIAVQVGHVLDRPRVTTGGSILAVGLYVANVSVATPIPERMYPIMALQIVTMIAAALTGVALYRLVAAIYGRRLGLFAGCAVVVGTPVGFWASLPKRHAFTALPPIITAYLLYQSRQSTTVVDLRRYRALAYVPVGLTAWIHAPEALMLFVALFVVDIATADRNDPRTFAVVGSVFFLSLLPFFVTNTLIAGNPLKPPRMLPAYGTASGDLGLADSVGGGGGGFLAGTVLGRVIGNVINVTIVFGSLLTDGATVLVTDSTRLFEVFGRSGYQPAVAAEDGFDAINLTVLESAPLLAGLAAVPVVLARKLSADGEWTVRQHFRRPVGAVDAFIALYALLIVLLYITRLPLHAQVTVRYLHPLFPVGIYGLVRVVAVRDVLRDHARLAGVSYLAALLVGGQLLVLGLAAMDPGLGEAVQFHAVLGLSLGLLLAVWVVAGSLSDAVPDEPGAVLLALTAGGGTVFLLLSGIEYFDYAGPFALPIVRVLAEALTLV